MSVRSVKGGHRRSQFVWRCQYSTEHPQVSNDEAVNKKSRGVVQFKRHVGVRFVSMLARISSGSGSSNSSGPISIPCPSICELKVECRKAVVRLSERDYSAILRAGDGLVSGPNSESEHYFPERESRRLGKAKIEYRALQREALRFLLAELRTGLWLRQMN